MFSFFKSDPAKKLKKKRSQLLKDAVNVQRSGDLKAYARMMDEVDKIEKQIEELDNK